MRRILPLLAFVFAAIGSARAQAVDVHGFISQGYMDSSSNIYLTNSRPGSFEFNEFGLNVASQIRDDLRIGLQLMARDLGETGNNEVYVDWAFADWSIAEGRGFRMGKIKLPFGLYNDLRDLDLARTGVLMNQAVYTEDLRQFMAAFEGFLHYGRTRARRSLEYDLFWGNQEDMVAASALNRLSQGLLANAIPRENDPDPFFGFALRWNLVPDRTRIGMSWFRLKTNYGFDIPTPVTVPGIPVPLIHVTPLDIAIDSPRIAVYSLEHKTGKAMLSWELNEYWRHTNLAGTTLGWGSYGNLEWRFTERFRGFVGFSKYYRNALSKERPSALLGAVPDHFAWQKDNSLGFRYDVSDNWILKVEWHDVDGTGLLDPAANPAGMDPRWNLFLFKSTFLF